MFEAYESLPGLLKMDFQCKYELTYTHKCFREERDLFGI